MAIILEGRSGSGKSTLLAAGLRGRGLRLSGVCTARVLGREGERLGFALYSACDLNRGSNALLIRSVREGETLFLAFDGHKPQFRYDVYRQQIEENLDPTADLLIIDEFGGLELLQDATFELLRTQFAAARQLVLCLKSEAQLKALARRAGLNEAELEKILERRAILLGPSDQQERVSIEELGREGAARRLGELLDRYTIQAATHETEQETAVRPTASSNETAAEDPHPGLQRPWFRPSRPQLPPVGSSQQRLRPRPKRGSLWLLAGVCLAVFLFSFTLGHYPVSLEQVLLIPLSRLFPTIPQSWPAAAETALFRIRLPRLILAALIGGGLSLAGAAFQAVFRNPLVSPDGLGAAQGAACGAALAILLGLSSAMITALSFVGGLLSILIVLLIASRVRFAQLLSLILTGLVVGSLASASLSLMKLLADPNSQLPAITYWLMGSLASARLEDLPFAVPCLAGGSGVILLLRWKLNLLTLSEEEARSLGLRVKELRLLLLLAATLVTATAVSVSGVIGWIGLVVPHAATLLFGADHRRSLPGSFFLGAAFTLGVDDLARLLSSSEIPLGILTAFIGAPAFLLLLLREGRIRERRPS